MRSILLLLVGCLCSCVGAQFATFNPDGTPKMAAQIDATLAEGEASAREMRFPNGTVFTSIQQKYDGTRVAGNLIDSHTVLGLSKIAQPANMKATKDNTKIDLKSLDNEGKKIEGQNAVNILKATPPAPVE